MSREKKKRLEPNICLDLVSDIHSLCESDDPVFSCIFLYQVCMTFIKVSMKIDHRVTSNHSLLKYFLEPNELSLDIERFFLFSSTLRTNIESSSLSYIYFYIIY
jgi:hypothetical protein